MIRALANLMGPLWRVLNSLSGRIFVLLTVGITAAAILSLTLAEGSRRRDFEGLRIDQLVARTVQIQQQWDVSPADTERLAAAGQLPGIQMAQEALSFRRDPALERKLSESLGAGYQPRGGPAAADACLPKGSNVRLPASDLGKGFELVLECWAVSFVPPGGTRLTFAMFQPPVIMPIGSTHGSPVYLLVLLAASASLSLLVARFVTLPLKRLADAAAAFAESLEAPDVDARGPAEVKTALSTFNIMQARVRAGLRERTQLLAAISHDLQTPLTRLRLRLEQVQDEPLRDRLVEDINATQTLVREGLDLARSHETTEPWSVVDIDSLVESLAADAAEFGADVGFVGGCGSSVTIKPNALSRTLNNLIENAVAYGGGAELSCRADRAGVVIDIRDHGPGIPESEQARLFEPFVRGSAATASNRRGTGIGLTIARAQAAASGATIKLSNHPTVGLVASVFLPHPP